MKYLQNIYKKYIYIIKCKKQVTGQYVSHGFIYLKKKHTKFLKGANSENEAEIVEVTELCEAEFYYLCCFMDLDHFWKL